MFRLGKRFLAGVFGGRPVAPDPPATEPAQPSSVDEQTRLFLETLLNTIPSPIFYKDVDGRYIGCNAAFEEFLGRSRDEIVGKTVYEMGPKDVADKYYEKDQELFNHPGRQRYEWKVQRKNGERRDVVFDKATFTDRRGNVAGLIGVISDITDRNLAEKALAESEGKYRQMFELSPSAIILLDTDSRVVDVNERIVDWLGFRPGDAVGKNLAQLPFLPWTSKLKAMRRFNRRIAGLEVPPCELVFQTRGGQARVGSVVDTAVRDDFGAVTGDLLIISDITALKDAEERRRQLEAQVRQRQRLISVGTLAGGVAHEINNPITGILNHGQLLLEGIPGDERLLGFAREIVAEGRRVAEIVNDLRLFSQEQQLPPAPARVATLVNSVLSLCHGALLAERTTVATRFPDDLPDVPCRAHQIRQVLLNVVTNAREALNEKYPDGHRDKCLTVSAAVSREELTPTLRLTVEDRGIGIPGAVRDRVFDPFFTTKQRSAHTGLGLSVSHGIVADHGGRMLIESEEGRWTCVHIDLPLSPPDPT